MLEKQKWQIVCDETKGFHSRRTSKMKVEGGWLYLFEKVEPNSEVSCQSNAVMQFVPKPKLKKKR